MSTSTIAHPPSASLYVGDLDRTVSEATLFEIFQNQGAVASIRVCRDAVTRLSLGYAYVNFHQLSDAERALETLNFTPIPIKGGRPCRIMWSERDPARRKNGVGNVFVKNLDKTVDNKSLHDTFSMFGNIVSVKVAQNKNTGESLGYGFVHFSTDEDAQKAIDKVNGMSINGSIVKVEAFKPRGDKDRAKSETFNNVYAKNFPETFTQQQLEEMFGKFGPIESAKLATKEDGSCAGYGFVCFQEPAHAVAAISELNKMEIAPEKELYVGRAQKKAEREKELKTRWEEAKIARAGQHPPGCNLYIKNLQEDVTEETLRSEFSKHGTITSAKIMTETTGRSKGFGFICFDTAENATKAVNEENKKMFHGMPLYVCLAMRRDVRRNHLEQQFAAARAKLSNMGAMGMGMGMGPMYTPYGMQPYGQMPRGPGGFMYPQMMMPQGGQGRGPMGGQGSQQRSQVMPNYAQQQRSVQQFGMQPQMGAGVAPTGPRPGGRVGGANRQGMPPAGKPMAGSPTGGRAVPVPSGEHQSFVVALSNATPDMQKQMIGEKLYPIVERTRPNLAGKITGMLLEIENAELLHLLETPADMEAKITEAVHVLREAGEAQ